MSYILNLKSFKKDHLNVYDLEIQMLTDIYLPTQDVMREIKLRMRQSINIHRSIISTFLELTLISITILIFSTIYSIVYNNYLLFLISIITNTASIILQERDNIVNIVRNYKIYVLFVPFLLFYVPHLALFIKLTSSVILNQILFLKLFYRHSDYLSDIKKSKDIANELLNSPILKNTKLSRHLIVLNEKYYMAISRVFSRLQILKLISILIPLFLYPAFKLMSENCIIMVFIASLLTLLIITKTYSFKWINPKVIIYYCVVSTAFWLLIV